MKRVKFDWIMLLLSFSIAFICICFCLSFMDDMTDSVWGRVLWSGIVFALPLVGSLAGVALAELIRSKRYVVQKKGSRARSIAYAAVLPLIVGCVGQVLYMIDIDTKRIEIPSNPIVTEAPVLNNESQISLLIDFSDSVYSDIDNCKQAACELVDRLDESTYFQYISFAAKVFESTDMTKLDQAGKEKIKEVIRSSTHMGMTDLLQPIEEAYTKQKESGNQGVKKSVIMISDGVDGTLKSEFEAVKHRYLDEDIAFYLIKVKGLGNFDISGITDLAQGTGGIVLPLQKNGIDYNELLAALEKTVINSPVPHKVNKTYREEHKLYFGTETLPFGNRNINIWKILLRFLVFAGYSIIATWTIYYSVSKRDVLTAIAVGIAITLITTILGDRGIIVSAILFDLAFWSAFTVYHPIRKGIDSV